MWEKIETYIRDHREEIDRDEPSPMVWNNIEKALKPEAKVKKMSLWSYVRAAAMVMIAVGAGYWWSVFQPDIPLVPGNGQSSILEGIHLIEHSIPEMEEVETYYTMEFAERMEKIKKYDLKQFPATESYMKDLAQVDECIAEIKKDMEEEGFHDQIIEAMITNFDQKIAILEQLLIQLEKTQKANSNPPA